MTINGLLPGPFDTDRLRGTSTKIADAGGRSFDEVHQERMQDVPAKRFGTADEFGAMAAFLCSAQGSYITGQNIVWMAVVFQERFRRSDGKRNA